MKKISLILCLFGLIFSSCDTDFDVNAPWKETTVVYGLLDPGKELQQIRISKAFLGDMDALQMAQYSDSTNYPIDELEVKVYRMGFNTINDSVTLIPSQILIDGGVFNDDVVVYEFHTDSFNLEPQYIYQLAIRNLRTNNKVTAETEVITNFSFTNNPDPFQHQFGQTYRFAFYNDVTGFKDKTVAWDRVNNGMIYQLEFIFNYNEDGESKKLVWRQGKESYTGGEMQSVLEGEKFFNFLSLLAPLPLRNSRRRRLLRKKKTSSSAPILTE